MKNPFVVGGWVRGERFFGRQELLREVLDGERACVWVLGTRRLGKTSFLKQLEQLASADAGPRRWVPLFWDLEGSQDLAGLREGLIESVEAISDRLEPLGIAVEGLEPHDLFGILRILKRKVREAGVRLLLLCDECEELINIERSSPETIPRLRRVFQEGESVRTVLAATKRLFLLERRSTPDTSPFLHGFVPPLYLGPLDDPATEALLGQGGFPPATVRAVLARTDNHPYLTQLVGKRLFDGADLEQVMEEIAADDMVSHFFAVDYQYLTPAEKQVVLHVAQTRSASSQDLGSHLGVTPSQASALLQGLSRLGYVRLEGGMCSIPNWFFERWLQRHHGIEPQDGVGDSGGLASLDAESSMELLRRAHDGDQSALVRLCERYHAAFRRWAAGRLPHVVRGRVDTEDLLRQTLFSALGQAEAQKEGELWEQLRHELLERIRAELGRLPVPMSHGGSEAESNACAQEEVIGRDKLARYEAALSRLTSIERQAIVTRIEMGCSYEQVAECLGKPSVGAARMSVCRALVRLAREMSNA